MLVVASCGDRVNVAATAEGTDITVEHLHSALETIPDYANLDVSAFAAGDERVTGVLQTLIVVEVIRDDAEDLGLDTPDMDEFSASFIDSIAVLADGLAEGIVPEPDEAERQRQIDEFVSAAIGSASQPVCVSHLLVETEDEALAAAERIAGGEAFADVAQDVSTGPSGPEGGFLGCDDPSAWVPAFAEALVALDVDEISDPVQTDFGFHLIWRQDSVEAEADLEAQYTAQAEQMVDQRLLQERNTAVGLWIDEHRLDADVEIDPMFGVWDDGIMGPPAR
ncbi:MAG: hypothetical protein GY925_18440 [Actinomycetia bacterium]|nr:hypothetical protein [Actinomycetes bacterium]